VSMSIRPNETAYIKQQYATSANLDARIALHKNYSTSKEHFHDWLFDHVALPAGARVLEIGCGSGAIWQHVFARVPKGWRLTITDYSFGMATQARANLQSLISTRFPLSQLAFSQADAQSLPFPDATFDGIFANHMLYHIPDLDRALGEIRRVLKPDGTLYAATNGLVHLRELGELSASVTGEPFAIETPEHFFGLENGGVILGKHFQNVTRDKHENNLRVTAVGPLVAYIESGILFSKIANDPAHAAEFRRRVQQEIDTNGAFHITKSVGMFIANQ
jgi:SAM-dependent methyltransferase